MARRRSTPSALSVLLHLKVFRRLWTAIAISSFGDWLGLLATTALAAYLTKGSSSVAQGAAVSGVLLTRLLPDLVLGPFAGALVDRLDRRTLAVVGDSLAAVLYLSIAVTNTLVWLLIAQFLVEAIGLFTTPAKQAMWVNIVPRERLAVANQLNYVSIYGMVPVAAVVFALLSTATQFFGARQTAAVGTSLISSATNSVAIDIALVIDAATYVFVAATVLVSRRLIPAYVNAHDAPRSIFALIREGVAFIATNRLMRAIYVGILGAFGAGGLVAGVAQFYVASLGAGNAGYGLLFGAVFTGLALGMLIGPKVWPGIPRRRIFTGSIASAGVSLIVMSLLQDFVGAAVAAAILGLFAGCAWITGFTMIGQEVSDELRGRVFAFVMSSVRLTLLATISLAPWLAGALGTHVMVIGSFGLGFSGSATVLAIGGALALAVGIVTGRQIAGPGSGYWRRLLGRGAPNLLDRTDYPGVLIALEGADPARLALIRDLIAGTLRAQGWETVVIESAAGFSDVALGERDTAHALRASAALADLVTSTIRPRLEAGTIVVANGFVDRVVIQYGVLAGLNENRLSRVTQWAAEGLLPHVTVIVDAISSAPAAPAESPAGDNEPQSPAGDHELESPAGDHELKSPEGDEAPYPLEGDQEPDQVSEAQAYRNRASYAPERYVIIKADAGLTALSAEVTERLASVIRLHDPVRIAASAVDPAAVDADLSRLALVEPPLIGPTSPMLTAG